ncbi:MAG: anthranilate phosphoribosyltransferase [FCB group bacterium]|jgi:anthranilate phosphoribosyltransferase|nr:anthranilate phosphoribosyltransferase [FCB group bacterium]
MIEDALHILTEGQNLTRDQAAQAMRILMTGECTPAQVGAFLVGLRIKGETSDEITGFAETMRALATRVETSRSPLVDTCGTGGDHSGTFNISTTAAFVVAGAGVAVAKHGNRSATSLCGSADVLEALGVNIDADAVRVGKCIDEIGIGFLFARSLHGAMKNVAAIRRELRVRTVFNLLGPLTNPAGACGQVMGVFKRDLITPIAQVLANLGTRHAFVVAGSDGLDELTLSGTSSVAEARDGKVSHYELDPADLGLPHADRGTLKGGDAQQNANILLQVLGGESGPRRDIVLLNAAAGILAGQGASDWSAALDTARAAIDSGAAKTKLNELILISQDTA